MRPGHEQRRAARKLRRLNPKLETLPVNRPLGAFGFLICGLALAMFAVSSTSRSTGVRPLVAVNHHATLRQPAPGNDMPPIATVPSENCTESSPANALVDDSLCDPDSLDYEGPGNNTRLENLRSASGPRSEMKSVRLYLAERTVVSGRTYSAVDCRSHYDRAYDKIIYGQTDIDLAPGSTSPTARKNTSAGGTPRPYASALSATAVGCSAGLFSIRLT